MTIKGHGRGLFVFIIESSMHYYLSNVQARHY